MTKFIFVRHGQSKANASGMIADEHSRLTEEGLKQARKTGYELTNMGTKTIICSPFLRAQQTAETIAGELGIDIKHIKIIDELHERRLGKLEGTPKVHDSKWYETTYGEEGMELRPDIIKRMQKCLDIIRNESKNGLVLAVGHSGSGFYLLEIARGRTEFEDFSDHTQIKNADFIVVNLKD